MTHGPITVVHGDSREELRTLDADSFDSCVTDPPYALGFMGSDWDNGSTAFDPEFWREVSRVLKPGAHVVAFSGTRTYHRMACAIEDAGFEIRDQIEFDHDSEMEYSLFEDSLNDEQRRQFCKLFRERSPGRLSWTFGSGFPKSHNIGEGMGTALKPAVEPICVARKPISEKTVAANVLRWGTSAINVDACRVGTEVETWPVSRSYAPGQLGSVSLCNPRYKG